MTQLVALSLSGLALPALIANADERARRCFLKFFTATIRNAHTGPSFIEEIVINKSNVADAVPVFDRILLRCQVTDENVTQQLQNVISCIYSMSDVDFKLGHTGNDWSLAATTTTHSFIAR